MEFPKLTLLLFLTSSIFTNAFVITNGVQWPTKQPRFIQRVHFIPPTTTTTENPQNITDLNGNLETTNYHVKTPEERRKESKLLHWPRPKKVSPASTKPPVKITYTTKLANLPARPALAPLPSLDMMLLRNRQRQLTSTKSSGTEYSMAQTISQIPEDTSIVSTTYSNTNDAESWPATSEYVFQIPNTGESKISTDQFVPELVTSQPTSSYSDVSDDIPAEILSSTTATSVTDSNNSNFFVSDFGIVPTLSSNVDPSTSTSPQLVSVSSGKIQTSEYSNISINGIINNITTLNSTERIPNADTLNNITSESVVENNLDTIIPESEINETFSESVSAVSGTTNNSSIVPNGSPNISIPKNVSEVNCSLVANTQLSANSSIADNVFNCESIPLYTTTPENNPSSPNSTYPLIGEIANATTSVPETIFQTNVDEYPETFSITITPLEFEEDISVYESDVNSTTTVTGPSSNHGEGDSNQEILEDLSTEKSTTSVIYSASNLSTNYGDYTETTTIIYEYYDYEDETNTVISTHESKDLTGKEGVQALDH